MPNSNTFTVSTTNKHLLTEFNNLEIEGVRVLVPLETKDFTLAPKVYGIAVTVFSSIAVPLFVSWLYDQLKRHDKGETKIEGQAVPHDRSQITNLIMGNVTINHYDGKVSPDDERIPEEAE